VTGAASEAPLAWQRKARPSEEQYARGISLPQQWIVEHTDAAGIIDIFRYERYGDAIDVADQTWEAHKDQSGHVVRVYQRANPNEPAELIYTCK
jgi:hypothetical protein